MTATHVLKEVSNPDDPGRWHQIGELIAPSAPDRALRVVSFSLKDDKGFRVLCAYGFDGYEPCVWESVAGVDITFDAVDAIGTYKMKKVSDLAEPYQFRWKWRGRLFARVRALSVAPVPE